MNSFNGKVAIITGGARGIGKEIALCLAKHGADITLIDVLKIQMEETAHEINELGREVLPLICDVSIKSEVDKTAAIVEERLKRADILVTSAGIGQCKESLNMEESDWISMISVNLNGTFFVSQAYGKIMRKQNAGKIIMIGSISGTIVNKDAFQTHYNVSKAGVIHLAKCLAAEWAPFNINVNCISPGYVLTDMITGREEEQLKWKELIPANRLALPSDLTGAVLYLASDEASYTTGLNFIIDGGYTVW